MSNVLVYTAAGVLTVVGVSAAVIRLFQVSHDRTDAETRRSNFRENYPSVAAMWDDCPGREDTPLTQHVPNIGGTDNPKYGGPDYIPPQAVDLLNGRLGVLDIDDNAAEFRSFQIHPDFEATSGISIQQVLKGDLAWDCQPGRVAPDGGIWLNSGVRCGYGTVSIFAEELPKAQRFGWIPAAGTTRDKVIAVTRSEGTRYPVASIE